MEKICSFTGHRKILKEDEKGLYDKIISKAEALISDGFCEFRCGGAVGFDRMAADAIIELRQKYPHIKLHIYVPCLEQNKFYSKEENGHYITQLYAADKILCISEKYYNGCMLDRNKKMVDGADALIAYLRKEGGGSAYTVRYAEKLNCRVIRL